MERRFLFVLLVNPDEGLLAILEEDVHSQGVEVEGFESAWLLLQPLTLHNDFIKVMTVEQ